MRVDERIAAYARYSATDPQFSSADFSACLARWAARFRLPRRYVEDTSEATGTSSDWLNNLDRVRREFKSSQVLGGPRLLRRVRNGWPVGSHRRHYRAHLQRAIASV